MEHRWGSVRSVFASGLNLGKKNTGQKIEKRGTDREKEGWEADKHQIGSTAAQVHIESVSGMMMSMAFVFSGAFEDRSSMWILLGRQEAERKEVKKRLKRKKEVISGGKSNSEEEDKRDREERKVRARGSENVDERRRFTLAGLNIS